MRRNCTSFAITAGTIFLGIIMTPLSYGQETDTAEVINRLYGQGVHQYNSGNYVKAYDLLSSCIDGGIRNPSAYYFRGLAQMHLGRVEDAHEDFKAGSFLEEKYTDTQLQVGYDLQRIQGELRLQLEKYRLQAKLAAYKHKTEIEEVIKKQPRATQNHAEIDAGGIGLDGYDPGAGLADEDPFAPVDDQQTPPQEDADKTTTDLDSEFSEFGEDAAENPEVGGADEFAGDSGLGDAEALPDDAAAEPGLDDADAELGLDDAAAEPGLDGAETLPDDAAAEPGLDGAEALPDDAAAEPGLDGAEALPDNAATEPGLDGAEALPDDAAADSFPEDDNLPDVKAPENKADDGVVEETVPVAPEENEEELL